MEGRGRNDSMPRVLEVVTSAKVVGDAPMTE